MSKKDGTSAQGGHRQSFTKVKTARGRKASSTRWLQRQLNDPFVAMAQKDGYRSRAAYKILEINEKFDIFAAGCKVVDLGAAPGGWTQIAENFACKTKHGHVVALDILPMEPMGEQVTCFEMDFLDNSAPEKIKEVLGGEADVVMTDMAPAFTGHASTDHLRTMVLVEAALELAEEITKPGGHFVAKILRGSDEHAFLNRLKQLYRKTKYMKPESSRKESSETYVVGIDRK